MIWIGIVLACILLIVIRVRQNAHAEEIKYRLLLQKEYGSKPLTAIQRQTSTLANSGRFYQSPCQIDDITWNDLDLDRVFTRINYTHCAAGAEYLYRMLRNPSYSEKELQARNELISLLQENETARGKLCWSVSQIGFSGKYCLEEYLEFLEKLPPQNNAKIWLMDFLYIPGIVLLFFWPLIGLCAIFAAIFLNITFYFREKAKLSPYLSSFAYILRMLSGAQHLAAMHEKDLEEKLGGVMEKLQELRSFQRFSGVAMSMRNPGGSSNPIDILMDYIRMLFHVDLMKFNQMLQESREKKAIILKLNDTIGEMDAALSIAYYRASLEQYCVPERSSGGINGVKVAHPLLDHPVKNTLVTETSVLITGSNASGKSTFLKTVALNALFAQSIVTCLAEKWSGDFYHIMSSMALRDNLTGGDSYYMVEIKALKRIMDAAGQISGVLQMKDTEHHAGDTLQRPRVLCFIDEVLRGTNTIERIAASSQILKMLAQENVLYFAATHDIELASLLEKEDTNYHFSEELKDGAVTFSYLLQTGRATSHNAIKLLDSIGYDPAVTRAAEKMAENFLQTGEWKMLS